MLLQCLLKKETLLIFVTEVYMRHLQTPVDFRELDLNFKITVQKLVLSTNLVHCFEISVTNSAHKFVRMFLGDKHRTQSIQEAPLCDLFRPILNRLADECNEMCLTHI